MHSQTFTDGADIGCALVEHVVNPSGKRPRFEIATPQEAFPLVTVEDTKLIFSSMEGGKVTFVSFFGKTSRGEKAFMWPTAESPALVITGLRVLGE